jgi:hypothetical protein
MAIFNGKNITVNADNKLINSFNRPGFSFEKNELYFMQDGGEKGLEIGELVIEL